MNLEKLLKERIKVLKSQLNEITKIYNSNFDKLKKIEDDLVMLELFLSDISKIEDIRNIDTSNISELLLKNKVIKNIDVESELYIIKEILKAKLDYNLKTNLNNEQLELLKKYINDCVLLFDKLEVDKEQLDENINSVREKKQELESIVLELEILHEKVSKKNNNELLDEEDLRVIKIISEDKSLDSSLRKNILIKFIEYNNEKNDQNIKSQKVDINEVKECFEKHGINISNEINKNKDEVESHANIKNILEILEYMNSVNITKSFKGIDLLIICLYGTKSSVQETYENISKIDNNKFYYSLPSAWVSNLITKKVKKRKHRDYESKEQAKKTLSQVAHTISREEINQNINYLKKEGFIFSPYDIAAKKTLTTSHYKLKEAVEALKLYGIIDEFNISTFKIWILSEPQIVEKIDRFVELGLLGGKQTDKELDNYLKKYPGKLHGLSVSEYIILYQLRQQYPDNGIYYSNICSVKKGQLSGNLNNGIIDDDLQSIKEFNKINFVSYEEAIPNYSVYEDKIDNNYDVLINDSIFNNKEVMTLEHFSVDGNPLIYDFNGVIISRFKVLRNISLIYDGTRESLLSSIVNGSYLTRESFERISKCVDHVLGGNYGLLL